MDVKFLKNLATSNPMIIFLGLGLSLLISIGLIVFLWLIITTGSFTEPEGLNLPISADCIVDNNPPKDRLMLNIAHLVPLDQRCSQYIFQDRQLVQTCEIADHWKIIIKGQWLTTKQLERELVIEGNLDREIPGNPRSRSNRPVMIRAEAGAPVGLVKQIYKAMEKALMWKVEIGAEKPFNWD